MSGDLRPTLTLYNTLTRSKEVFVPLLEEGKRTDVGIYTCGLTVYSEPHVGNMRPYIFADILRSVIKHILDYPVKYVVNITDVGHLVNDLDDSGEDKMEKGSRKEGISAREVARKYENHFKEYLGLLNVELFDEMPRATDYIAEQIDIVKDLIQKGYTYTIADDGIYMDTSLVKEYGKLLGPSAAEHLSGLQAGARIENELKRNATDFALRKFSPADEQRQMEWIFDGERSAMLLTDDIRASLSKEEEATRGFPGRHIECSAMSRATLGNQFDIHTGGVDHIPIHHTDEIAQSECSFCENEQRVKYRLHVQFLNIDGKKVSKSAGDDLSIPGLIERGYDPLDFRYFLLTSQYRNFLDFTRDNLTAAKNTRRGLINKCYTFIKEELGGVCDFEYNFEKIGAYMKEGDDGEFSGESKAVFQLGVIKDALCDDLATPVALSFLHMELRKDILANILRLDAHIFKLGIREGIESRLFIEIPDEIDLLAKKRMEAKQNKDFLAADTLREQINQAGYDVKDTREGYTLEKI